MSLTFEENQKNILMHEYYRQCLLKEKNFSKIIKYKIKQNDITVVELLKKEHNDIYRQVCEQLGYYPYSDTDCHRIVIWIKESLPRKHTKIGEKCFKRTLEMLIAEEGQKVTDGIELTDDLIVFRNKVPGYNSVIAWLCRHIVQSQSVICDLVEGRSEVEIEKELTEIYSED